MVALKSGMTRHADAPRGLPRFSTATRTRAARRPLSCRLPREAGLRPADPGVVDLDLTVERFARHIDHRSAELVKHHPGRFVAAQPQLALEQERRNTPLVGRHQVGGPEPQRSAGSSCCEEPFPPSARLDSGRRHTASVVVSPSRTRARGHIADTRNHRASDTWPDTAGRPPRSRTGAETRADSLEKAGAAPAYTTDCGLLKQPDKRSRNEN